MKKILGFSILVAFITYSLIEISFIFRKSKPFEFSDKEWIHHAGFPENTIAGLKASMAAGYRGIEIDVFYLTEEKKFIVTHDMPLKGPKLYLEDILKEVSGKNIKLWLDYKNAKTEHLKETIELLRLFEKKYNLKNKLLIESQNHLHQVLLSRSGLPTVLWVSFHSQSRLYFLRNFLNRLSIVMGDFVAISFSIESWQEGPKNTYQNLNKLVFTVNDLENINTLKQDPTVKVVLKDLPLMPALPQTKNPSSL